MARETWAQSQVESYKRLKKWYLMPPCLTLSIIRYGSRVKWSNPGKGQAPFLIPWCSRYRKGSLQVTLDYGHQLYLLFYNCSEFDSRWVYREFYILVLYLRVYALWKSDLTDKMKHSFFQAAIVSILLYGCTTWVLTKRLEKRLDCNYTRMLLAILNNSWMQPPTKQQLYGHLPPITKLSKLDEPDMQDTAEEVETSSLVMYSYGPLHMAEQKQGNHLESTYSSSVRIRGVALRTGRKRWTIGRVGERGSGISVLMARKYDEQ